MTRMLITGASGNLGMALLKQLSPTGDPVVATDIRKPPKLPKNVRFATMDVRGPDPAEVIARAKPEVVVHLASIVTPPKGMSRDFAYAVDVTGTRNVLDACLANGVRRIVVTSSGAAYGYHADNPKPLTELDPLRGNREFAYSWHKRLVEEMLAEARINAPQLEQVILRVGTVLGAGLENQITALFHRKRLLAVAGSDSPFVFIWTKDLARILLRAATNGPQGIYNVAGDGALSVKEIAAMLKKPVLSIPASVLKGALAIAKPLGLTQYGPEQVGFLQYRPVLDNTALKRDFGYAPNLTSAEVFDLWRKAAGL